MCTYHSTSIENKTILKDKKKNGQEQPWKEKKIANVQYYELLEILQFKKAARVSTCAEILEFDMTKEGRLKLAHAWFCKSPLCPICNWRKTMKRSVQTTKIVSEVIRRKPLARWLFLTLSLKNVFSGEELDSSLKEMAEGFRRLMMYKKVKQNLVGFMRATEVTTNKVTGSYNQHMHVLICVESAYFNSKGAYLSQEEWTNLWKKAMKLDYTPIVHIEKVKNKKKNKNKEMTAIEAAVQETAKYSVKDADYLTGNLKNDLEVVKDLEEGLYRKRMVAYGGLLKEIHKELNLDDVEEGDLVRVDNESEEDEKAYSVVAQWNWKMKNYYC